MSMRVRTRGNRRRGDNANLVRTRGVRNQHNAPDAILVDWNRAMMVVGPVTDDASVPAHDTAWTYGSNGVISGSYWICDLASEPADDTPSGTNGHWNRKMQPMRFSATPYRWSRTYGYVEDIGEVAVLQSPGVATVLPPRFRYPAPSVTAPPVDGHFGSTKTGQFSISIPFGAVYGSNSRAKYLRLLVDGADVTGVVSIDVLLDQRQASFDYFNGSPSGVTISEVEVSGKTIEVDIWFEVDVTLSSSQLWEGFGRRFAAVWAENKTHGGRYGSVAPHIVYFIRGIEALNINAKRAVSRNYEFTFSQAISGGTTSATTVSDGTWTVTRDNNKVRLDHNVLPDFVELIYGREIAEIKVGQLQTRFQIDTQVYISRYVPAATGHYADEDGVSPGIFKPAESQTFELIGIPTGSVWYPDTITVGPIT